MLNGAGEEADEVINQAFTAQREDDGYLLKGVVSRKKQLIPALMAALQE